MQNSTTIETLTGLVEISRMFNEIKRVVVVSTAGKIENDSEHSFQLALCSWFVSTKLGVEVDNHKVVLYALVHDLPELSKGDISSIVASKEQLEVKALDEERTIRALEERFVEFPELAQSIKEYEKRDCIEAELVFFVDKILPVLNVWMSKDTYYKHNGITFEVWMQKQWGRIQGLSHYELFNTLLGQQIINLIRQNKDTIFAK